MICSTLPHSSLILYQLKLTSVIPIVKIALSYRKPLSYQLLCLLTFVIPGNFINNKYLY